jgi:hypothetical protein
MDTQQDILVKILLHFSILQCITISVSFLIYRQIRSFKLRSSLLLIPTTLAYLAINTNLVLDILETEDLCIGGITFGFEMGTFLLSVTFVSIFLFIWLLSFCQFKLASLVRKV